MGKLIVIEGVDCSGKETQSKLLVKKLNEMGYNAKMLSYPNYSSLACGAVNMYLNGEFGENANDINPYSASLFFAVDRIASFYKDWKTKYETTDTIFVADRYTTSNWIHQASKFDNKIAAFQFVNYSKNLEYELCKLPKPDKVLFLSVPFDIIKKLKNTRMNKIDNSETLDIHEINDSYLKNSHSKATEIAMIENWDKISCESDNNSLRSIEDISYEILKKIKEII